MQRRFTCHVSQNDASFTDQLLFHHLEHLLIIYLSVLNLMFIGLQQLPHFRIQTILSR